jgi:hypothetical protein
MSVIHFSTLRSLSKRERRSLLRTDGEMADVRGIVATLAFLEDSDHTLRVLREARGDARSMRGDE